MNEPIIEERFDYEGFPCVVMFFPDGFRYGAVGIPKWHNYYGANLEDMSIICHGGLIYSDYTLCFQKDKYTYWIVFGCNKENDKIDIEKLKKYYGSITKNKAMKHLNQNGTIRDFDYVKRECIGIVEQLIQKQAVGKDWC